MPIACFHIFSLHRQTAIIRRLHQSDLCSVSKDSLIYKWDSPEPYFSPIPPANMDGLMEMTKSRQWKNYNNNDKVKRQIYIMIPGPMPSLFLHGAQIGGGALEILVTEMIHLRHGVLTY